MKNILVFRTHRFGDILQTFPMVQGLREKYFPCRIFYVVDENYKELVEKSDLADEVFAIPYSEFIKTHQNAELSPAIIEHTFQKQIKQLKQKEIDLAVNRSYTKTSALFIHAINPIESIGKQYQPEKGYFFDDITTRLIKNVSTSRNERAKHLVDSGCQIANVNPRVRQIQLIPQNDDFNWWIDQRKIYSISEDEFIIGIQMGANALFRHWGDANYAFVIKKTREIFKKKDIRVRFGLFGEEKEIESFERLSSYLKSHHDLINFMGKTTFGQLAIALAHCRILLTVDTGTLHLATAVNTPVLGMYFASAYFRETGPYGPGNFILAPVLSCYPCYQPNQCPINLKCRHVITPWIVVDSLKIIFGIISHQKFSQVKLWHTNPEPILNEIKYLPFF